MRTVSHSIRSDGFDGFVLPYQELLALAEQDGSIDPSEFVAFVPEEGFEAFSNVAEHVDHARRYTNLFAAPDMLADPSGAFLERGLIHRTARGELVRSISEVVVADALNAEGVDYYYEKALLGPDGVERYPDFTAEDPATGVTVYWEHLGMLSDPNYATRWEKKLEWYDKALDLKPNGPENKKGERLVTSENRLDGAIDSAKIRQQVRDVFDL